MTSLTAGPAGGAVVVGVVAVGGAVVVAAGAVVSSPPGGAAEAVGAPVPVVAVSEADKAGDGDWAAEAVGVADGAEAVGRPEDLPLRHAVTLAGRGR
ncbi:hypothetical protein ABT116_36540, partial [Streptomyces sp. NPDC002130]|uniref:hypothetical protein n=1 Tax=Streptomyces sp. NPDC002130 TaxID=3155568 RepID=UPI00332578B0